MYDGDPETFYLGDGRFAVHGPPIKFTIFDFGAPLWLERIRFFPRPKHHTDRFMQRFRIGINDGDPLKDGTRELPVRRGDGFSDFDIAYQRTENTEAVVDVELPPYPCAACSSRPMRIRAASGKCRARDLWQRLCPLHQLRLQRD